MELCRGSMMFFISFTVITLRLEAQEMDPAKLRHMVALQFGVNAVKEQNLLPKVNRGTIIQLSYGFEIRREAWQEFRFAMGYSRLRTEFEDVSKTVNLALPISYSYSFPVVRNTEFSYHLGPEATLSYNGIFLPNWDDSHLYWADYWSVGLRNIFTLKKREAHEWVASISVPILSAFSRPKLYRLYKIDDVTPDGIARNLHSNLSAAHPANVFYMKLNAAYRFPLFGSKEQAFSLSVDYLRVRHDDGNPYQQISNQIGIKFFL